MLKLSLSLLLALVALSGCRQDDSEGRISRRQRNIALDGCVARIEVYPSGTPLPQPFRVLAPVDTNWAGNWGWTATSRYLRMKRRACELGADAIVDADPRVDESKVTTTLQYDAYGRPVTIVEQNPGSARRSTALAIQFVASPGVQVVRALPPTQVVVAPPPAQIVVAPPPAQVMVAPAPPQVYVTPPPPQVILVPEARD